MGVDLRAGTVKAEIDAAVLCWLATATSEGVPNVSPKELWGVHDAQTLVIADIASAGSVRNIRENPKACVSFVDVFRQRGLKLVGQARVVAPAERAFAGLASHLLDLAGEKFKLRHVIVLSVERITPIVAPSYALHDASEDEMKVDAYRTYSVSPVGRGIGLADAE